MNEIWKDIPGYEGLYQVSNLGRIYSLYRKRLLNPVLHKNGYVRIGLTNNAGKRKLNGLHRLIAMAFIDNPDNKPWINHINGITNDNRIENLEWCTASENELHSHRILGKPTTKYWLGKTGAQHYWSKPIVCIENGKRYDCSKEAAKELKVQAANISKVLLGLRRHTGGYTFKFAV
jgi:hypothetical protein